LPDDLDARTVVASAGMVYAGTVAGLYASADHGATWQRRDIESAGLRFVTDVAVDPRDARRVYVASFDGVGRSTDAGSSWTRVTAGTALDGQSCTSIAINPADPATLYAGTFTGVYRSRDTGATWEPFSAGITNNQIVDLVVDPKDGRFLYAATQFTGVYVIQQSDVTPHTAGSDNESGCAIRPGPRHAWWIVIPGLLAIFLRRRANVHDWIEQYW